MPVQHLKRIHKINHMSKNIAIIFIIVLVLSFGIYSALTFTNFLIPISIKKSETVKIFSPEIIHKLETVYSFGNFKNHISFHDINGEIRCNVYKFNNFKELPEIENVITIDSIGISGISESYFGTNPTLTVSSKLFTSYPKKPKLMFTTNSNDLLSRNTEHYSSIYGNIKHFGLFNSKNECKIKFDFDIPTKARLVFFKTKQDFYIIIYYGINGYEIDETCEILKPQYKAQSTTIWNKA
jgi:hypothetical protein